MPFESSGSSWVTATRALPCPYCGLLASRLHQQRCTKRPATCPQCRQVISAASLAAHMAGDCPEKKVVCPGCGDSLLASLLEIHITTECPSHTFICCNCCEAFSSATDYVRHALPRCTRMVVTCQLCGAPVECSALAVHYRECSLKQLRAASEPSPPKQDEGNVPPAVPPVLPPSPRRHTPRRDREHSSPLKRSPAATTVPYANVHVPTNGSRLRPATAPVHRSMQSLRAAANPQIPDAVAHLNGIASRNDVLASATSGSEAGASLPQRPASARVPVPGTNSSRREATAKGAGAVVLSGSQHRQTPIPFGDGEPRRGATARGVGPRGQHLRSQRAESPDRVENMAQPITTIASSAAAAASAATTLPPTPAATHAFVLRQKSASAKRQFGPLVSSSLVVKDRRQALWSETIRRRELELHLRQHQTTTPELPSFIVAQNGRSATGRM